jgi:inorganic pyrophosphatase
MLDAGEADDKIVAVLRDDPVYGDIAEIAEVPGALVDRLIHYFSTYKRHRREEHEVSVGDPYGRVHAEAVITSAMVDYVREFPASADVS